MSERSRILPEPSSDSAQATIPQPATSTTQPQQAPLAPLPSASASMRDSATSVPTNSTFPSTQPLQLATSALSILQRLRATNTAQTPPQLMHTAQIPVPVPNHFPSPSPSHGHGAVSLSTPAGGAARRSLATPRSASAHPSSTGGGRRGSQSSVSSSGSNSSGGSGTSANVRAVRGGAAPASDVSVTQAYLTLRSYFADRHQHQQQQIQQLQPHQQQGTAASGRAIASARSRPSSTTSQAFQLSQGRPQSAFTTRTPSDSSNATSTTTSPPHGQPPAIPSPLQPASMNVTPGLRQDQDFFRLTRTNNNPSAATPQQRLFQFQHDLAVNAFRGNMEMDLDMDGEDDGEDMTSESNMESSLENSPNLRVNGRAMSRMDHRINSTAVSGQQQRFVSQETEPAAPPSSYSHFRYKVVCRLDCRHCDRWLCSRGMKAILLADTKVELYSTDSPPSGGNIVGYHVTQPCESCLDSCNNGHFWMFQTEGVVSRERMDATGNKPLLWAFLPTSDKDYDPAVHGHRWDLLLR